MQQRIMVLANPEEALVVNTQVDSSAMIDAITAINDRTEAIFDILIKSIQNDLIKDHLLCSVTWQLQANMDCLLLFVNNYIQKQYTVCINLIAVAKKKATDIIMCYGITDKVMQPLEEAVETILMIKRTVNKVAIIACHQELHMTS